MMKEGARWSEDEVEKICECGVDVDLAFAFGPTVERTRHPAAVPADYSHQPQPPLEPSISPTPAERMRGIKASFTSSPSFGRISGRRRALNFSHEVAAS